MARLEIPDPAPVIFSVKTEVCESYINAGNHVGNESYVTLLNKTAEQFFEDRGVHPYTVNKQVILNTEFSVQLKSEVKLGSVLTVEMGVDNFHRCGCDFIYRVNDSTTEKLIARAKFSFLTFDYQAGQLEDADSGFKYFFIRGGSNE